MATDKNKSTVQVSNSKRIKRDPIVEKGENRPGAPTAEEEELCSKFDISMKEFQIIKTVLVRESLRQGTVNF